MTGQTPLSTSAEFLEEIHNKAAGHCADCKPFVTGHPLNKCTSGPVVASMNASYARGMATKPSSGSKTAKKPAANKRVPGIDKGKIWMADDFDVLSESELAEMLGVAEERLEKRRPSLTSSQVRKAVGLEP